MERVQAGQRVERPALIVLCASTFAFLGIGATWDHHWHTAVGRGTPISPPHLMMYLGILLCGGATGIAAARAFLSSPRAVSNTPVIGGGSGFRGMGAIRPGYRVVIAGTAFTAVSAIFDQIWHRTIGDTTIWSPPHVMAILGGIIVAAGTVRALFEASRDGILPPIVGKAFREGFPAMLLITAYFGVLPAAVLAFAPSHAQYAFFNRNNPYIVAGISALLMPALVRIASSLGRGGWRLTVGLGLGWWVVQEVFPLAATPVMAGALHYQMRPNPFPDIQFEAIALAFMLIPALLTAPLIARRPGWGGAVCGFVYTIAVGIGLALAELNLRLSVAAVAGPAAIGLISGLAGGRVGRWLHL